MASWTNTHTTTTLAKWIPSVWAAYIEPVATPVLVGEGAVVKWPIKEGAGTTYVPKMTAISMSAMPTDGDDVTLTGNTEDYATLTPTARHGAVHIPWQVAKVIVPESEVAYRDELARSIRKDKDAYILAEVANLTTHSVGSAGEHVSWDGFKLAKGKILGSDAEAPFVAVFHTDEYAWFYDIDRFVDAGFSGSADRIESGVGGTLLGCKVYFSSNVYQSSGTGGASYNIVMSNRCLVHGALEELEITIDTLPIKGHSTLIMGKYMADNAVLNDGFGCLYLTQTV